MRNLGITFFGIGLSSPCLDFVRLDLVNILADQCLGKLFLFSKGFIKIVVLLIFRNLNEHSLKIKKECKWVQILEVRKTLFPLFHLARYLQDLVSKK